MPVLKFSPSLSRGIFFLIGLIFLLYCGMLLNESIEQQYEGDDSRLGGFLLWLLGYAVILLMLATAGWLTFKGPYRWRSLPRFGKWGYYAWLLILFWIFFEFLQYRSFHEPEWVEENLFTALFGWLFVLGFVAVADAVRQKRLQATFEQEKAIAELHALRTQLHPHFLFNALNTLYAQAIQGTDGRLAELIEELSGMLRFSLAQSRKEWVPIEEEMAFLTRYINLQKARLTPEILARLQVELADAPPQFFIPPLLLLPIVENFFKYGISHSDTEPLILKVSFSGSELKLYAQNPLRSHNSPGGTGQGLKQVGRRLDLIFPESHSLLVKTDQVQYRTWLSLDLPTDPISLSHSIS